MYRKTIKKRLEKKLGEWLSSIKDEELSARVKNSLLVSGGSIASMFLNEKVNDYDIYLMDMDVLKDLCVYYSFKHNIEVLDGRKRDYYLQREFPDVDLETNSLDGFTDDFASERFIKLKTLKPNQIKLDVPSEGKRISALDAKTEDGELEKYTPKFFSPNAISLSDDIQIVCRFSGDAEKIHETFDFIHATNYFTFNDGLVTNIDALECLLGKQLKYQGSHYPLTSIIRSKKFIKRGWNIGAGEYLKIMFQISELDLTDPEVLEEQLIGVDVAYFGTLIKILRNDINENPELVVGYKYISELIDKVFGEEDLGDFNEE
jgi:hypothetical protein